MPKHRRVRRRHPNWPVRWVLLAAAAGLAVWLFVPTWWRYQRLQDAELSPNWGHLLSAQAAEMLGVLWFAFFGASVGSFLNVVVWRLPRGRSLLGRSYCPWCAVQIKSYDNLPILGWLLLRGRCRACRLPISPRYPLVESLMCAVFVSLFLVGVWSGGANIPGPAMTHRRGVLELVFTPHRELLGLYFFHAWMLFHLVAWSLIRWDRLAIPRGYGFVCLATPLVAGIVFPWLYPVGVFAGPFESLAARWPQASASLTGVAGILAGLLLGNEFDLAWRHRRPQATWFLTLVGVHLGWQAVLSVALWGTTIQTLCVVVRRIAGWPTDPRWPLGAWFSIAAMGQVLLWRPLATGTPWWPGPETAILPLALWTVAIVAAQLAMAREWRVRLAE